MLIVKGGIMGGWTPPITLSKFLSEIGTKTCCMNLFLTHNRNYFAERVNTVTSYVCGYNYNDNKPRDRS